LLGSWLGCLSQCRYSWAISDGTRIALLAYPKRSRIFRDRRMGLHSRENLGSLAGRRLIDVGVARNLAPSLEDFLESFVAKSVSRVFVFDDEVLARSVLGGRWCDDGSRWTQRASRARWARGRNNVTSGIIFSGQFSEAQEESGMLVMLKFAVESEFFGLSLSASASTSSSLFSASKVSG
jgi:hypothetical protein